MGGSYANGEPVLESRAMSRGSGGRIGYRLAHLGSLEPWLRRLVVLAGYGLWPRVLGRRHVPRGPLVVTGTHLDRMDLSLFLAAVGRHIEWVAAQHFLDLPVYGALAAWGGWHPVRAVEFGVADENATALDSATTAARGGAAVGVFAQGFTTRFGSGPARIAAAAGAPVLPVFTYRARAPAGRPRVLVVVHRPVPAPAGDPRSRRRFCDRLRRRMGALGALRASGDGARIRQVALDDAALWRRPLAVIRRAARLARARDAGRLGLLARFLLRGSKRVRCSVGDLRRPAGLALLAAFLAMFPLVIAGLLLVSPALLALLVPLRGLPSVDVRSSIMRVAPLLAAPYGLVLAAAGWFAAGAWGLALPAIAGLGMCCVGPEMQLGRRLCGSVRARLHGRRLLARLAEFDRLVAAAGG